MRARLRPIFLSANRLPKVYFQTTSELKYTQASLVFERAGLVLHRFSSPEEREYREDYSVSKQDLLKVGLREVLKSGGRSYFLFIEDTSVRIEALSGENDVPGVQIKEWFGEGAMNDVLDNIEKRSLSDAAKVVSDIALHVPGLSNPVWFSGETSGKLARTPSSNLDSPYPWLRGLSFSSYLIPDGAEIPLAGMSLDTSWEFDFRVKSLTALIDRLEEYTLAMNAPAQAIIGHARTGAAFQPRLFESTSDEVRTAAFAVIGKTCAGKTTAGEYLSKEHGFRHIEASSVLRTFSADFASAGGGGDPFHLATAVMTQNGFAAVADRIIELFGDRLEEPFVISGFRTLEEVRAIRRAIPWLQIVLVEADEATRYARYVKRGRETHSSSLEEFRRRDDEQDVFGLLPVAEHISNYRIVNQSSLTDYFESLNQLADHALPQEETSRERLITRILLIARDSNQPMTPTQIETASEGASTAKGTMARKPPNVIKRNSVRKVLGTYPRLVRKSLIKNVSYYELSEAGRAYLELLNLES